MIGERTGETDRFWQQCREKHGIETGEHHLCTLADPAILDPGVENLDLSDHPRLIRERRKNGTAHLAMDFEINGIPSREAGDYWLIPDFDNRPLYLVKVVEIVTWAFAEVPLSWAEVEGEGDLSLRWWRDAHHDYFSRQCARWGRCVEGRPAGRLRALGPGGIGRPALRRSMFNLATNLESAAAQFPDREAVVFRGRRITYRGDGRGGLPRRRRARGGRRAPGRPRGARLSPTGRSSCRPTSASSRAGAVAVCVSALLKSREIAYQLEHVRRRRDDRLRRART